jgi:hypothetical protein
LGSYDQYDTYLSSSILYSNRNSNELVTTRPDLG